MENDLESTRVAIENYQLKSYNRGRRLAGQIIHKLAADRVYYRFRMWHENIKMQDHKLSVLDFIAVTKRNRRITRQYFNKYVSQIKKKRFDDNIEPRAEHLAEMLKYRALKRMFKGMLKFQTDYHIAKANLRKRLVVMDLRTKKSFFLCWKQQCDHDKQTDQVNFQGAKV